MSTCVLDLTFESWAQVVKRQLLQNTNQRYLGFPADVLGPDREPSVSEGTQEFGHFSWNRERGLDFCATGAFLSMHVAQNRCALLRDRHYAGTASVSVWPISALVCGLAHHWVIVL